MLDSRGISYSTAARVLFGDEVAGSAPPKPKIGGWHNFYGHQIMVFNPEDAGRRQIKLNRNAQLSGTLEIPDLHCCHRRCQSDHRSRRNKYHSSFSRNWMLNCGIVKPRPVIEPAESSASVEVDDTSSPSVDILGSQVRPNCSNASSQPERFGVHAAECSRKKIGENDFTVKFSFIMTTTHHMPPDVQFTIWGRYLLVTHPPHSPDLAAWDFYLFSKIKRRLRGKWIADAEETAAAYGEAVEATPKC
ncbi:hypothetical protein EVAR_42075_1 [Eumeta japonica]|uniref:Mariner Mos1 transposase n=1 Tax=Eumeta variegata TaxID=151549 RepID=A0A4C1XT99_EUMVA|nr:hypothetical protein EVAR_42075_1 [Eumeta japonica]